jgi:AcrR family transcriptional regulator
VTAESQSTQARRPGRPRSIRADKAILQATVELLAEIGYSSLTIEGIAERAGVGKTTIYRRFDSIEEIIISAFGQMTGGIDIPDTGDTHEDLRELGRAFMERSIATVMFPVMGQILGTALTEPAVLDAFKENLMIPRQAALRTILERGVQRGDVRPDIDIDLIVDLFPGGIIFHVLFQLPPGCRPSPDYPDRVTDTLWSGIKPG